VLLMFSPSDDALESFVGYNLIQVQEDKGRQQEIEVYGVEGEQSLSVL
jgi:hypothetical protein